jgi:hypothetical protein
MQYSAHIDRDRKMAKQSAISVRLPEHLKAAVDQAAAADHRSTASLVEKILSDWLISKEAESAKQLGAVILPSGRTFQELFSIEVEKQKKKMAERRTNRRSASTRRSDHDV